MATRAEPLGAALAPTSAARRTRWPRLLENVAASFHDYSLTAAREAEQRGELSSSPEVIVSVPQLGNDLTDLTSVLDLGRYLWGSRSELNDHCAACSPADVGTVGDSGCSGRRSSTN